MNELRNTQEWSEVLHTKIEAMEGDYLSDNGTSDKTGQAAGNRTGEGCPDTAGLGSVDLEVTSKLWPQDFSLMAVLPLLGHTGQCLSKI